MRPAAWEGPGRPAAPAAPRDGPSVAARRPTGTLHRADCTGVVRSLGSNSGTVSAAAVQPPPRLILSEPEWLARRTAHETRVRAWTDPHQARRSRGEKHPTEDFLWEYYSYRASWLKRWHPGPDVILLGPAARDYLRWPEYREGDGGVSLDPAAFDPARRDSLVWLRGLLRATAERPAFLGCHALHEWAMVYRLAPSEVRHTGLPLRLPPEEIAALVESRPPSCSHFDAFRFFTPPARPLNRLQPTRATSRDWEQRGCLHANMDLYKWAFKLSPFTPSGLLADCFALAREIRAVDMRASPYDVSSQGLPAIRVETPEGRAEFERLQADFAKRSQPLRARLAALCDRLLAAPGVSPSARPDSDAPSGCGTTVVPPPPV